jgi:hypothetical protein
LLVVSEELIELRARLPKNLEICAPTVHCWMRPTTHTVVTTKEFVQFGMLSEQLVFTQPTNIKIFGSKHKPPGFKEHTIKLYPEVRWVPPPINYTLNPQGFTPIHLAAAGMLPVMESEQVWELWSKLSEEQRLKELNTSMTKFPAHFEAIKPQNEYTWQEFVWLTQYRTPKEIAKLLGTVLPT